MLTGANWIPLYITVIAIVNSTRHTDTTLRVWLYCKPCRKQLKIRVWLNSTRVLAINGFLVPRFDSVHSRLRGLGRSGKPKSCDPTAKSCCVLLPLSRRCTHTQGYQHHASLQKAFSVRASAQCQVSRSALAGLCLAGACCSLKSFFSSFSANLEGLHIAVSSSWCWSSLA